MMQEEKSRDYLRPSWPVVDDTFVTQSDRTVIVDWLYSIVDTCQFDHEMVIMAMGMVDRFLSKSSTIAQGTLQDRKQFRLVAIAALSICIKTNEKMILGSEFLPTVARNIYSANEIKDMELNILEGLSSGIHVPTSSPR